MHTDVFTGEKRKVPGKCIVCSKRDIPERGSKICTHCRPKVPRKHNKSQERVLFMKKRLWVMNHRIPTPWLKEG